MGSGWQMIWKFAFAKERNVSARTPAIWRDQIIGVFGYDRKAFFESTIIALSMDDGRELWRRTIDHVANEPVIDTDGTIYVASFGGAIHAYAPDGSPMWTSAFGKSNINVPVLSGDRLFVAEIGGSGSKTWCLNKSNGDVVWSYENGGHSYRLLAHDDKLLHATAGSGTRFGESTIHLHCLRQGSGEKVWSIEVNQYHFRAIVAGGLLLWGARGALNAYDPTNGELKAHLPISDGTAITSGPVVAGDKIIIADDSGIIRAAALERKGLLFKKPILRERWSSSLPDAFVGEPVIVGDHVYVLGEKGKVHRFGMDGRAVGPILSVEGGKRGGLTSADGKIAVSSGRTIGVYRP